MRRLLPLFGFLAAAPVAAAAQEPGSLYRLIERARLAAPDDSKLHASRIDGRDVRRAVSAVTSELRWHTGLQDAVSRARELGRPIFWVHALGDVKGHA